MKLDIEMSFTDQNGVILLIEELLSFIWPSEFGKITTPFPRLSYEEVMLTYGSDKPDIGCSTKVFNHFSFKFTFFNYLLLYIIFKQHIWFDSVNNFIKNKEQKMLK